MDSSIVRVRHFSTTFTGGAGIAARTLSSKLLEVGVDSTFLTLRQPGFTPEHGEKAIVRQKTEVIFSGLNGLIQSKLSKKSYFSLYSYAPLSVNNLLLQNEKNSIIHIHNWFNLTNLKVLNRLAQLGHSLVLTLHDERNYTGGCHSTLGCLNFQKECSACPSLGTAFDVLPSLNLEKAKNNFSDLFSRATFIAPSKWIKAQAESSSLLRNSNVVFIPNFISAQSIQFKYEQKSWPIRVGFAAIDPNSYIKGGDFFRAMSAYSSKNLDKLQIYTLKNYQENMMDFWKTIDYLCVPSNADNSPNVIHEAKIMGKPILARNTGGIPELLNSSFDILLSPGEINFDELIISMHNNLQKLSVEENYNFAKKEFFNYAGGSLDKHLDLYKHILESH